MALVWAVSSDRELTLVGCGAFKGDSDSARRERDRRAQRARERLEQKIHSPSPTRKVLTRGDLKHARNRNETHATK